MKQRAKNPILDDIREAYIPKRKGIRKYCGTWDAYYFRETGEWSEKACTDPQCSFCVDRPARHDPECGRCSKILNKKDEP